MSSISDIISSAAATNPVIGNAVATEDAEAQILASAAPGSSATMADNAMTNLIAAANSQAALAPAANYSPSADLQAAMNAAASAGSSGSTPLSIQLASTKANTESSLLNGLGGSFDGGA